MRRTVSALLVPALCSLAFVPACGGDADTGSGGETPVVPVGGGDAASLGDGGTVGAADTGPRRDGSFVEDELADASYPADVRFTWDSGVNDAALTADAACAETSATATLRPLDLFVVLDRSGSMSETSPADTSAVWGTNDCNVSASPANTSKWCLAVNALGAFFGLAGQGDRRAALQFFPTNLELSSGVLPEAVPNECNGTAVGTPAVALVNIPASASSLVGALNTATPNGSYTTTEGAIRGMNAFTSTPANRSATRTLAQVLITDGAPTACTLRDNPSLAALIDAQRSQLGVNTYVVGMNGANYTNLEALATAGGAPVHTTQCAAGTASCHYYDVGAGSASAFSAALRDIQLAAVGCTYNLPTPSRGVIDPDRVRVSYQSGANSTDLARVTNAAACPASGNGWYYDNNTTPSAVRLCTSTCTTVRADSAARINVLFGCLRG
jgi:hypothetical protein